MNFLGEVHEKEPGACDIKVGFVQYPNIPRERFHFKATGWDASAALPVVTLQTHKYVAGPKDLALSNVLDSAVREVISLASKCYSSTGTHVRRNGRSEDK